MAYSLLSTDNGNKEEPSLILNYCNNLVAKRCAQDNFKVELSYLIKVNWVFNPSPLQQFLFWCTSSFRHERDSHPDLLIPNSRPDDDRDSEGYFRCRAGCGLVYKRDTRKGVKKPFLKAINYRTYMYFRQVLSKDTQKMLTKSCFLILL